MWPKGRKERRGQGQRTNGQFGVRAGGGIRIRSQSNCRNGRTQTGPKGVSSSKIEKAELVRAQLEGDLNKSWATGEEKLDVAELILERWPGRNKVLDRRRGGEGAAVSCSIVRAEPRPKQGWSQGPGGAGFSPRHSVALGLAWKPVPHTQRKLPGVFSQRPRAQGIGTRRHSSTSEGTEKANYKVARQRTLNHSSASLNPLCPAHLCSECHGG